MEWHLLELFWRCESLPCADVCLCIRNDTAAQKLSRTPSSSTSCLLLTLWFLWQLKTDSASSCNIEFVGVRAVFRRQSARCSCAERRVLSVCEPVSHDDVDINILSQFCTCVELVGNKKCIDTGTATILSTHWTCGICVMF